MSIAHVTPYPLCWPIGWDRTARRNYRRPFKGATFARGRDRLANELERLGAIDCILSTNVPLRLDGQPRGDINLGSASIGDPGVAVYFTLKGRPMTMARDEYVGIVENITSLALAIEYLRGLNRHGGAAMMERAFSGFAALPAPGDRPSCWIILGIDAVTPATLLDPADRARAINEAYRAKARLRHPDAGGTNEQMAELNAAREEALREAGAA